MDQFVNPTTIIGVFAVCAYALRALVDWRSLHAVAPGERHITRAEYDRDEKARKEQYRELTLKCRHNARRHSAFRRDTDGKFVQLLEKLTGVQLQLARLATCMEEREGVRPQTKESDG